ncbi:MAG TPA: large conductance mechanosensitive channel protein MscL [Acidimicrobiales bacterium]|nr:large conductance mechanosensitive channel protein MscL [Acidimicrobiales bacterium]
MAEKKSALSEFKDFVVQGNVIDLAVAVIIATAFKPIITDVVNLILAVVAIPGKQPKDFSALSFTIGGGVFKYGILLNDLISFVIIAAVVFFAVVRPIRTLMERRRSAAPDPESTERPCPECLTLIPKDATRCRACGTQVPPMPVPAL